MLRCCCRIVCIGLRVLWLGCELGCLRFARDVYCVFVAVCCCALLYCVGCRARVRLCPLSLHALVVRVVGVLFCSACRVLFGGCWLLCVGCLLMRVCCCGCVVVLLLIVVCVRCARVSVACWSLLRIRRVVAFVVRRLRCILRC